MRQMQAYVSPVVHALLAGLRRIGGCILAHGRQAHMVARVLIIGGYGHFGSYIARSLAGDGEIRLLVGGRSVAKAQAFIASLSPIHPAEADAIDINGDLPETLSRIAADVVIHTSGPLQSQDHRVACACVAQGRH